MSICSAKSGLFGARRIAETLAGPDQARPPRAPRELPGSSIAGEIFDAARHVGIARPWCRSQPMPPPPPSDS